MHVLLDQEAPGMSAKLDSLPLKKRRDMIASGCVMVGELLADLSRETRDLLEHLKGRGDLSPKEAAQAQVLADIVDERYFELQADGNHAAAIKLFSEARLLTAMAVGFTGTSVNDTADALYDLFKACDDPSPVIHFIEAAATR